MKATVTVECDEGLYSEAALMVGLVHLDVVSSWAGGVATLTGNVPEVILVAYAMHLASGSKAAVTAVPAVAA